LRCHLRSSITQLEIKQILLIDRLYFEGIKLAVELTHIFFDARALLFIMMKNREIVVPGLTVGIVGYAVGNYLGLLVAQMLKMIS
jgi:uncharacterized membrane protein